MSGFYDNGLEELLARSIGSAATVNIIGVNDGYVYDRNHADFAIFSSYILLPEKVLSGVSFTAGVLKADDPTWSAAGAGIIDRSLILRGVVIYFSDAGAKTLLAFIDSASVGLPQTLTGVDVSAYFDSRGILKI